LVSVAELSLAFFERPSQRLTPAPHWAPLWRCLHQIFKVVDLLSNSNAVLRAKRERYRGEKRFYRNPIREKINHLETHVWSF